MRNCASRLCCARRCCASKLCDANATARRGWKLNVRWPCCARVLFLCFWSEKRSHENQFPDCVSEFPQCCVNASCLHEKYCRAKCCYGGMLDRSGRERLSFASVCRYQVSAKLLRSATGFPLYGMCCENESRWRATYETKLMISCERSRVIRCCASETLMRSPNENLKSASAKNRSGTKMQHAMRYSHARTQHAWRECCRHRHFHDPRVC